MGRRRTMKLTEALSKIHAPKGMTTVIAAVMSGDFKPIRDQSAVGVGLEEARSNLAKVKEMQSNCGSDWAWWGYEGDVAYWSCVISLLEAAELVGPDNLPDVEAPSTDGVVMDVQSNVEGFGRKVLQLAKAAVEGEKKG